MYRQQKARFMIDKLLRGRHREAQVWKKTGGKVVGYLCNYVPEEIIAAAGILPIRIFGDPCENITEASRYLPAFICPMARSILDLFLKERCDYLDGIVGLHSCDTMCGLSDILRRLNKAGNYTRLMRFPHIKSKDAKKFFLEELYRLKSSIEQHFGRNITHADLQESIKRHDKNRQLLHRLYELKLKEPPLVSSVEMFSMTLLSMTYPKVKHNTLLENFIDSIQEHEEHLGSLPRLHLTGSSVYDLGFIKLIETCGANLVSDDICTGSRYFWNMVGSAADPMNAIAERYLSKVSCFCTHPVDDRLDFAMSMIQRFRADGVVVAVQKFCDPYLYEFPYVRKKLEEVDLPYIFVELDHGLSALESLETRIRSFVETIR